MTGFRRTFEVSYRPQPGSIAWLLHRLSGLGLVVYLALHIWTLHTLTEGKEAFEAHVQVFKLPIMGISILGLWAAILFHALNGLRLMLVDFLGLSRRQKPLLWGVVALTAVGLAAGGWPIVRLYFIEGFH